MLTARSSWVRFASRASSSYTNRAAVLRGTFSRVQMSTAAAAALPDRAHAVLSYWFGPDYASPALPGSWAAPEISQRWYGGGDAVDQYIKQHFSADVEAMRAGSYDSWQQQPLSAVAGIVLADQFTR
eukprot:GHRQ01040291.1.p1 GENE.GHRQ01040291.1~~GHRQ01040291.1.p1  ORF type:complete len:127 (+),score=48.70 GHRQ01040291.1:210-590(+)